MLPSGYWQRGDSMKPWSRVINLLLVGCFLLSGQFALGQPRVEHQIQYSGQYGDAVAGIPSTIKALEVTSDYARLLSVAETLGPPLGPLSHTARGETLLVLK